MINSRHCSVRLETLASHLEAFPNLGQHANSPEANSAKSREDAYPWVSVSYPPIALLHALSRNRPTRRLHFRRWPRNSKFSLFLSLDSPIIIKRSVDHLEI